MSGMEIERERYALAMDRIRQIPGERLGESPEDRKLEAFFSACADFALLIDDTVRFLAEGGLEKAPLEELARRNRELYADILPEHYGESYGNPAYAVQELGEELGPLLSFLYTELRSMIGFAYEGRLEELVIRLELFVEIYTAFFYGAEEKEGRPSGRAVRGMIYWFVSDYADVAAERRLGEQLCPEGCFAVRIITESDLTDVRYLYGYGEYVGEEELETARRLARLPEETIAGMAGAYCESCRRGIEAADADLSRKKTVTLGYQIGVERMLRRAIARFGELGFQPVAFRTACSALDDRGACRQGDGGFYGGAPNQQYEYDHKDDKAIYFDKNYVNRKLESMRAAFEKWKTWAGAWAGTAVAESFGEQTFRPAACREALRLSAEQERLFGEYRSRIGMLKEAYLPEESGCPRIGFPAREAEPVSEEQLREGIGQQE